MTDPFTDEDAPAVKPERMPEAPVWAKPIAAFPSHARSEKQQPRGKRAKDKARHKMAKQSRRRNR